MKIQKIKRIINYFLLLIVYYSMRRLLFSLVYHTFIICFSVYFLFLFIYYNNLKNMWL